MREPLPLGSASPLPAGAIPAPHGSMGLPPMVQALLGELADLLQRFVETGERGSIDLLRLPLPSHELAQLRHRLGRGEAVLLLRGSGRSRIHETGYAGLWWAEHRDAGGQVRVRSIEVGPVPTLLPSHDTDIQTAARQLASELHRHQEHTHEGP